MKKKIFFLFSIFILTGCGQANNFVSARVQMFKAENAYAKAFSLKSKRVPYEQRLPYYRTACDLFFSAYELDSGTFTLSRIHDAADSCWRVDDQEKEDIFAIFGDAYAKEHPKEFEYGDTDAPIPE